MTEGGIALKQPGNFPLNNLIVWFEYFPTKIIHSHLLINSYWTYFRTEQTATLKVDGGHIITGASPGKLRQLNGNGHLFIGNDNFRNDFDWQLWFKD